MLKALLSLFPLKGEVVEPAPHTTFVIRIWWTQPASVSAATQPRWYGRVEHIESGQTLTFRDLSALLAFLQEHSGLPSSPKA